MASIKKSNYRILRKPRITEKAAVTGAADNSVVFDVLPSAGKLEIKAAVEEIFQVKVREVRTLNYIGKTRQVGKRMGQKKKWKKAYVSLKEGHSIDLIEGL